MVNAQRSITLVIHCDVRLLQDAARRQAEERAELEARVFITHPRLPAQQATTPRPFSLSSAEAQVPRSDPLFIYQRPRTQRTRPVICMPVSKSSLPATLL